MSGTVRVEIVFVAASGENWRRELLVPVGTSVWQAVQLSGAPEQLPDYHWEMPLLGVFGQRVKNPEQEPVTAGDQIEVYRLLTVDPKLRRKARADKQ